MLAIKPILLWTDFLILLLVISIVGLIFWSRKKVHLRRAWCKVFKHRLAVVAAMILIVFVSIGLLDSIHFRTALPSQANNQQIHYSTQLSSALDVLLSPIGERYEKSYSSPFALQLFVKEVISTIDGQTTRDYPQLKHIPQDIKTIAQRNSDIIQRIMIASLSAIIVWLFITMLIVTLLSHKQQLAKKQLIINIISDKTDMPWRLALLTGLIMLLVLFILYYLAQGYHILGTDKVGQDVFYQTVKSIRTGLIIGTLTTLVMLPFAILLGIAAGYMGGWVDDVIQYLYTTLSAIPSVLLIAAAVLSLQVFIANHPEWFNTLDERADMRLLALCVILGITSWTGLCRLLRAETLKLREVDYIQAAISLGTSKTRIITKHIMPNVMHIILIAIVLDFSALVLAEAVLSYVGVGVSPTTLSWGNMINSARLELAREPVVWWPIFAVFSVMFTLVLSANLFSDAVRDGFDPRSK